MELEARTLSHLSLVRAIASRMRAGFPAHIELDELVSAGLLGLIDAVHRFDPAKDTQFVSYARFRIRGAILDFMRSLDWAPRGLRRKKRSIDSQVHELTANLGRAPLEEEVATASDLSLAEYQQVLRDVHDSMIVSVNSPVHADGGEGEELQIPGPAEYDPLHQCIQNQSRAYIAMAIDELAEKQRLVLTLYYYEELTMREIGVILGVAESRVSQIHSAALKSLRAKVRSL